MKKILLTLAAALLTLSAQAKPYKTVAPDGPCPVGVRIERLELPGRTGLALAWYPARPGPNARPYVYNTNLEGQAVLNAPPDLGDAPYPFIIFSHGMGGCAPQHVFFNENLASHGYVVVAPDHAEAAMCHIEGEPQISPARLTWSVLKNHFDLSGVVVDLFGEAMAQSGYDFSYRPDEIKAAIDQALGWNRASGQGLAGMIDPDRIGLAGHSLGGYTGLMIGGMPFLCEAAPPENCDLTDVGLDSFPDPCCFDYIREEGPDANRDPRVKALFLMSAPVLYSQIPEAAAQLEVPLMIVNGDEFFEVPWGPVEMVYDFAPGPKYLVRLKQTDHMTAVDSTLAIPLARIAFPGFRSHFGDKAQAYKELSVAFFNRHLKNDDSETEALATPLNRFVELQAQP